MEKKRIINAFNLERKKGMRKMIHISIYMNKTQINRKTAVQVRALLFICCVMTLIMALDMA